MEVEPNFCYRAIIRGIEDADTYDVEVQVGFRMLARMPLRLAHIDTPKKNSVTGKAAIAYVTALLGPLPAPCIVHTVKPIEKYGRYLADIYLPTSMGPLDLAADLIKQRLGDPYEGGTKT